MVFVFWVCFVCCGVCLGMGWGEMGRHRRLWWCRRPDSPALTCSCEHAYYTTTKHTVLGLVNKLPKPLRTSLSTYIYLPIRPAAPSHNHIYKHPVSIPPPTHTQRRHPPPDGCGRGGRRLRVAEDGGGQGGGGTGPDEPVHLRAVRVSISGWVGLGERVYLFGSWVGPSPLEPTRFDSKRQDQPKKPTPPLILIIYMHI